MIFVISDLHGLKLSKLTNLLNKANISKGDYLYVLGDVIDRQNDGGVEILQWLIDQPNARLICGNHERMLLSCKFLFEVDINENFDNLSCEQKCNLENYLYNGGTSTIKSLLKLKNDKPERFYCIMKYIDNAPLYRRIFAGKNEFLLCHSGLGDFSEKKKIEEYTEEQLTWTRPKLSDRYSDKFITVFGHTPTATYGKEYKGKIIKTDTWINIDVGITRGNAPVLLCLDNLNEFCL